MISDAYLYSLYNTPRIERIWKYQIFLIVKLFMIQARVSFIVWWYTLRRQTKLRYARIQYTYRYRCIWINFKYILIYITTRALSKRLWRVVERRKNQWRYWFWKFDIKKPSWLLAVNCEDSTEIFNSTHGFVTD